ncbi:MAG TPA: sugar ABC transporter substrate-binding protein [Firmicutes bacterium]|nr:sugar ABC transporter substrate-binding protein [Bacillota bacterium]
MLVLVVIQASTAAATAKKTVSMLEWNVAANRDWQKAVIQRFMAENPDVEVEIVGLGGIGPGEKVQILMASGVPLDIGYYDAPIIVDWAKQNLLVDLTPYVARENELFSDWLPSSLDLFRVGNGLYGLPADLQLQGTYYNVDAYLRAGIHLPDENLSWDDVFTNARKLLIKNPDGTIKQYGYKLPTGRNWLPMIWAWGGDFLDNYNETTKFTGRDSRVAEALEYMANLVRLGLVPDKEAQRTNAIKSFTGQESVTLLTNTIVISTFTKDIKDFVWDVAPVPKGPAGRIPYINAIGMYILSTSKDVDLAWKLLKYFCSPEIMQTKIEQLGLVPPGSRMMQMWARQITVPEHRQYVFVDADKAKAPFSILNEFYGPINTEAWAAIWGEKPVWTALEQMEEQVNQAIKEYLEAQKM